MDKHFVCNSCLSISSEIGVCEKDGCDSIWEMLNECNCTDNLHGSEEEVSKTFDSNGNELNTGDTAVLIKDLTLRGTSRKYKQGTKVTITLRDNTEEVDCKIEGTAIVLRTEFLKKI